MVHPYRTPPPSSSSSAWPDSTWRYGSRRQTSLFFYPSLPFLPLIAYAVLLLLVGVIAVVVIVDASSCPGNSGGNAYTYHLWYPKTTQPKFADAYKNAAKLADAYITSTKLIQQGSYLDTLTMAATVHDGASTTASVLTTATAAATGDANALAIVGANFADAGAIPSGLTSPGTLMVFR